MTNAADAIRAEQVSCYDREDFLRYFALAEQLVTLSPGYARSYECWMQTVFHCLARRHPDLVFLQVGAMDGKRYDPIYAFVKHYRWRGLVLEPLADLFSALAHNYAGHDHVTLVQAALLDVDGPREMTRVIRAAAESGAVPAWAEGLGSFFPERNALGGVGVGEGSDAHAALLRHVQRETVDCVTLSTLATRHGLDRIDLLQVDAEGCELEIVRQVDDHGLRPAAIHLEHWALSSHEKGELFGLLGQRGYSLRMSESDVLAIDPDLRAAAEAEIGWPV